MQSSLGERVQDTEDVRMLWSLAYRELGGKMGPWLEKGYKEDAGARPWRTL